MRTHPNRCSVVRAACRSLAFAACVFGAAASAWAQDYQVTKTSKLLETRPAGATIVKGVSSSAPNNLEAVDLPFDFVVFGRSYSRMSAFAHAFLVPGDSKGGINLAYAYTNHGQDPDTDAFPYTPNGVGGATDVDGLIAALWCPIGGKLNDGSPKTGYLYTWVAGTAPSRHVTFSWENVDPGNSSNERTATIQIQLYEGTNRIVFAYSTDPVQFTDASYVCGIDAAGESRFVTPVPNTNTNKGYPGNDFIFDPRTTTYTGRARYDRIVSDATGIGNTVEEDVDLGGFLVQVRGADGAVAGYSETAADGSFSVSSYGAAADAAAGHVTVAARNAACTVATAAGGPPTPWAGWTDVSFASDESLGEATLGSVADPSGALRAAFRVAQVCAAAREWALARTSDDVPPLDVAIDDTFGFPTSYRPADDTTGPLMYVGGASSVNLDTWDDALVTRTYGRHVLASIAASPTTKYDDRFDAVTDAENAFAEGFGYALWAAVSGTDEAVDGIGASQAVVRDLESPTLTEPRGAGKPGAVAAALFDLVDAANEPTDAVDGTGDAEDRWFDLVDAQTDPVTTASFFDAWTDAGHDAVALTRIYIASGVLEDDALEPNDASDEAAALGPVGFLRTGLTLHRHNEDWYTVTLSEATSRLTADVTSEPTTTLDVEIRSSAGAVLATGAPVGATGRVVAATGDVPAGTYRIRVRPTGGLPATTYRLQAYVPLTIAAQPFVDWTVGRPYDRPFGIGGGVAPYTLTAVGSVLPPGLVANMIALRGGGAPTTAGTYQVSVELRDSGNPANTLTRTGPVRIHPALDLLLDRWFGIALGRATDEPIPFDGGTPPRTIALTSGSLPPNFGIDPETFRVTGTADAPGSTPFACAAEDAAGSADAASALAVVCTQGAAKAVPLDLAADGAACGTWIDAVRGSTLKFAVKTARKSAKRTLSAAVLAPGQTVLTGGKIRLKNGQATGTGIVAPVSGRYYVIVGSDAGPATQLTGSVGAAPPRKGPRTRVPGFGPTATTTVEVGALPGARLVLVATGDKKSGLVPRCTGLRGPDGVPVPLAGLVKTTKTGFTLSAELPAGGTWQVSIAGNPQAGDDGTLTWSWTVKQPKGGVYSAD